MRVTVVQVSDATPEEEWGRLVEHSIAQRSDLVLLGEMPFSGWLPGTDRCDESAWQGAVDSHDKWINRCGELGAAVVAGSRPVLRDGVPHNEGFVWSPESGYTYAHTKYFLPDEPGFWEATWYRRAPEKKFTAVRCGTATVGFMICTDMWFTEHARSYADQGADLLLVPRATEARTTSKWLAGGRAAAVMSGAFCLSSNRQGFANGPLMGGTGWIIDPDGDVLTTTSDAEPFVTLELDLDAARAAKRSYPRYVRE